MNSLNLKNFTKFLIINILKVIVCAFVGSLLLCVVYTIPTQRIEENVRKSAYFFENWESVFSWCHSSLDKMTDSLILLEASYNENTINENSSVIKSAMEVKNYAVGNFTPQTSLFVHYAQEVPFDNIQDYPRYWHGYLIFIKPLFFFTDYLGFKIINSILQFCLLMFLSWIFIKRNLKMYLFPYLLGVMFLMPSTLAINIQYSSCYYIMTIASIVLLIYGSNIDNKKLYTLFLYTGISVAFFDFLTYPLVTVGVPMVLYFSMTDFKSLKEKFLKLFSMLFWWLFGYGTMWGSKWIISGIILRKSVIEDAINSILIRSGKNINSDSNIQSKNAVAENVNLFFKTPVTLVFLLLILILMILIVYKYLQNKMKFHNVINILLPFIFLSLLPFIWYIFTTNHSYLHSLFTCKILVVFVFAVMCSLVKLYLAVNSKKKT